MDTIKVSNGWICIQYPDHQIKMCEIGYGTEWIPALLDTIDGQVVAKVRRSQLGSPGTLTLRVNGAVRATYKFIDN